MESADSGPRIAAGAWGQHHGRPAPSFWCRMLSSSPSSTRPQGQIWRALRSGLLGQILRSGPAGTILCEIWPDWA
eukprot:COSAG01_NODE_32087_length_586_cov_2.143737_1_plen_74_part_10